MHDYRLVMSIHDQKTSEYWAQADAHRAERRAMVNRRGVAERLV